MATGTFRGVLNNRAYDGALQQQQSPPTTTQLRRMTWQLKT